MVGELVLPEVIVGITEASATLSPSTPITDSRLSTTASGSSRRPIRAVPTGWKIVVPISPATRASSSSPARCAPGLYSSGRYRAIAGCSITRRAQRIDSAATRRSAPAAR